MYLVGKTMIIVLMLMFASVQHAVNSARIAATDDNDNKFAELNFEKMQRGGEVCPPGEVFIEGKCRLMLD